MYEVEAIVAQGSLTNDMFDCNSTGAIYSCLYIALMIEVKFGQHIFQPID